jgi:peroxiredoxin
MMAQLEEQPMKTFALAAAAAVLVATPALAALKAGDKAPDFSAPAYKAGEPFTYKLSDALKKGPVVLYFFPSAYTAGCNIEAHLFSEAADGFKAEGATVIGVTAGKVAELARFSKDTETCGGKFPVAADADLAIAKKYDALFGPAVPISSRTSYVIAPDGKVLHAYSAMSPNQHVEETMGAVKAWNASRKK